MKLFLTFTEQSELLMNRGLICRDQDKLKLFLEENNYYRISGYLHCFKNKNNDKYNLDLEDLIDIYTTDIDTRKLLFKQIEIFELSLRTKLAYCIAKNDGQISYLEESSYKQNSKNKIPLELIKKEINRSREKFIEHFKRKKENIPIWALVEILSLGTLSKVFANWENKNTLKEIYKNYNLFEGIQDFRVFLEALTVLRNLCAHHSRLFNRRCIKQIKLNKKLVKKYCWPNNNYSFVPIITLLDELVSNITGDKEHYKTFKFIQENDKYFEKMNYPTL